MLNDDLTKTATVVNALGLHARPAARIAAIATEARSTIWMHKNGDQADAGSIMDILSLACFNGVTVTLRATDPADRPLLDKIVSLIEGGFEEPV